MVFESNNKVVVCSKRLLHCGSFILKYSMQKNTWNTVFQIIFGEISVRIFPKTLMMIAFDLSGLCTKILFLECFIFKIYIIKRSSISFEIYWFMFFFLIFLLEVIILFFLGGGITTLFSDIQNLKFPQFVRFKLSTEQLQQINESFNFNSD